MTPAKVGLARVLSKMGYCSRSQAALLIRAGQVTLNGRTVRDPESPVRMSGARVHDRIEVDGSPIEKTPAIYLALNKPSGVVTTASDEKSRKTVYDLLDPNLPWVGPVGRLDKASEGLLLLTNDSEWAAKITEPSSHLEKTYHVQVDCVADAELLAKINRVGAVGRDSKELASVENLLAKGARLLRHGDKNSWIEITLDEGKNRQIRRLLEALGVGVRRLVRVAIGPLALGDLQKSAARLLTPGEKQALDQALRAARYSSSNTP
jgi:23S rRNA pseudouridine2605 synthase